MTQRNKLFIRTQTPPPPSLSPCPGSETQLKAHIAGLTSEQDSLIAELKRKSVKLEEAKRLLADSNSVNGWLQKELEGVKAATGKESEHREQLSVQYRETE